MPVKQLTCPMSNASYFRYPKLANKLEDNAFYLKELELKADALQRKVHTITAGLVGENLNAKSYGNNALTKDRVKELQKELTMAVDIFVTYCKGRANQKFKTVFLAIMLASLGIWVAHTGKH